MALSITGLTLQNGLRVVLVRDPLASEMQVTMRYSVGGVDDPEGQEGIAHLVEHLMFQQIIGTESIFSKLENTTRWFNATTSYDATTYTSRAPAERLDALLAIEMVRMTARCQSITKEVFAREREVVVNEMRMRDYAQELYTVMNRGVYPERHPYTRLHGGKPEAIGAITMEQACAFADAHYAPGKAVLVISGNLEPPVVEAALLRSVHNVRAHPVTPPPAVAVPTTTRNVKQNAPIDDDAVLLAWPLPPDPALRTQLRAVFAGTVAYIDSLVRGRVLPIMLGDQRAPMLGILIARVDDEPILDILNAAQKGADQTAQMFRSDDILTRLYFERFQQGTVYQAFAGLEEGSDRDERLAALVAAGHPPDQALAQELRGLRSLTTEQAADLATAYFAYSKANVVVLEASERTRGGTKISVAQPIHDIGQRRDRPDPALAKEPATEPLATREPKGMITRRLANGLRVILAPMSSVPTVDVRLVFAAGSADEPTSKRGTALLAGHGLEWRPRSLSEAVSLTAAGTEVSVDVGLDRTVFYARGLDMHVDFLLLGIARAVRDGKYRQGAAEVAKSMRKAAKDVDNDMLLTDAWREALYGDAHPYTTAGVGRHVSNALRVADAMQFRKSYFTPDNATIVISGRFDAAIANRWIDHLFEDWKGAAGERDGVRAAARPVSLAKDEALAQVRIAIALPAPGGTRAERMIAAAMLTDIAGDVRHQLGAAYVFDASYDEMPLASNYVIAGSVDAARTHEAITLIKTRIEELRTDREAAARAFVLARRRVLAALTATTGSAERIGERITQDLTLGRPPLSDVALAQDVHEITINAMSVALTDLDLSRAAILMNGPPADVDKAFAVLGRTPRRISATMLEANDDPLAPEEKVEETIEETLDAPDEPALKLTFTLALTAGVVDGSVTGVDVTGRHVSAQVGYRLDSTKSVGGRVSIASVEGTYYEMFTATPEQLQALPVALGIFFQGTLFDRVHGAVFASFDLVKINTQVSDPGYTPLWKTGLSAGAELSIDVLRYKGHRLTLYGRIEEEVGSFTDYDAVSYGLGYRLF